MRCLPCATIPRATMGLVLLCAMRSAHAEVPSPLTIAVSGVEASAGPTRFTLGHVGRVVGVCESSGLACVVTVGDASGPFHVHARGAAHFDLEGMVPDARGRLELRASEVRSSRAWIALPVGLASIALGTLFVGAACPTDACTNASVVTSAGSMLLAMTVGMHMLLSAIQPEWHVCDARDRCTESGHRMPQGEAAIAWNEAPTDPHGYAIAERVHAAPAAALEFGVGAGVPTLHAPVFHLAARSGVALHLPPVLSVIVAAESGVDLVGGGNGPAFTRVPLAASLEFVESRSIDDGALRALDFHFGGTVGADVLVASRCVAGVCVDSAAEIDFGFSLRMGVTYSARVRNALGLFLAWHPTVARCLDANGTCLVSTVTASLGWSLF